MYEWLGMSLALAFLFALNAAVSGLASLAWRICARRARGLTAAARVRLIFWLRVLPSLLALSGVALLLPAYLIHEPREAAENVSLKLAALAALSAVGLLLAAWRGAAAWWATRRLTRDWMRHAQPVRLADVAIPAYRLRHPFPVLAVVGWRRPRLFIAEQLLTALTPAELQAALKHEMGHLQAGDNFKRAALRVCRDVLTLVPSGRLLDAAWDEAAEDAADEFAAAQPQTALALAAALVKLARLAPCGLRAALPAQASYIFTDGTEPQLARRVKRLLLLAEAQPVVFQSAWLRYAQWLGLTLWLAGLAWLLSDSLHLAAVQKLNELIVAALQ